MNENSFQDILNIADKWQPKLMKEFLRSTASFRGRVVQSEVESALNRGDYGAAIEAIPWSEYDLTSFRNGMFAAYMEAGEAQARNLGLAAFDMVNPRAIYWLDAHSTQFITDLTAKNKEGIKQVLRNGFENGVTPQKMAKEIKQYIGLDARRLKAVENYRKALQEEGWKQSEIDDKIEKLTEKYLKERAKLISIEESLQATSNAAENATEDAVERGVIDPEEYVGERLVTNDDRTCEKCMDVEGEQRELPDGTYLSTNEKTARVHISCRCSEILVKRYD